MRDWLRSVREEANLSQAKVAEAAKIDITTVGKYELGLRTPSVAVAKRIASVLDFDWTMFYDNVEAGGKEVQ